MERDFFIQRLIESLNNELSKEEEQQFQDLLISDPLLYSEAKGMRKIWDQLDKAFEKDEPNAAMLNRVYQNIVSGESEDELSDDDLDQAAGGLSSSQAHQKNSQNDQE